MQERRVQSLVQEDSPYAVEQLKPLRITDFEPVS